MGNKGGAPRVTHPTLRIHVHIAPRYTRHVKPALLKEAARGALAHQGRPDRAELTVVVTGAAQLRKLNRQFRHIDKPTDVLSFGNDQPAAYLGDVIISYPTARAQANARGHPVDAELRLLVVHGVLHLLGHDHDTRTEKAVMWQAQREILQSMGAVITEPKD